MKTRFIQPACLLILFFCSMIVHTQNILDYFRGFQAADGSLLNVPYWMFTDWVTAKDWVADRGPLSQDGSFKYV